jgi:hypothetical protein
MSQVVAKDPLKKINCDQSHGFQIGSTKTK